MGGHRFFSATRTTIVIAALLAHGCGTSGVDRADRRPVPGTIQFGTAGVDVAYDVASDNAGFLAVAGLTTGTIGSDPASGQGGDLFVARFDPAGRLLWARQLGPATAQAVAVDRLGNVCVAASTNGSIGGGNTGGSDVVVVKFSPEGMVVWIRQFGTPSDDRAWDLVIDDGNNIYVAGQTAGDLEGLGNAGSDDLFVAKLAPDGAPLWTRQRGTPLFDVANGVAWAPPNAVFVTGVTFGALDNNVHQGGEDIFLVRFDSGGAWQWTRQYGTDRDDFPSDVAAASGGEIYVAGYTQGNLDGQSNADNTLASYDLFLSRFDAGGTRAWTRLRGSPANDFAEAVTVDGSGNVYVAGETFGNFGGPNADATLSTRDPFLAKYDGAGTPLWVRQSGSAANEWAWGVAADRDGNPWLAGETSGSLGGHPSLGGRDGFLMKYAPDGAGP